MSSIVQSNISYTVGSASPTLAFSSNVTAGNTILVVCSVNSIGLGLTIAPTDTLGNTYSLSTDPLSSACDNYVGNGVTYLQFRIAYNITGGACTVATNKTATQTVLCIIEIAGLLTTNPFDIGTTQVSSSSPIVTGNITSTATDLLIIGCCNTAGQGVIPTINTSGYTTVNSITDGTDTVGIVSYKAGQAAGSYNASASTNNPQFGAVSLAAFKELTASSFIAGNPLNINQALHRSYFF